MIRQAVLLLALTSGTMQMHTRDFPAGGTIPKALMATECGGQNRAPLLRWAGAPAATKSFALIMHDRDAPIAGGFFHWVVYDIPASAREFGASSAARGERFGLTTNGKAAYWGPCPPPGPVHHYTLTLYALDVAHVASDAPLTGAQLEQRVSGHTLARASIEGTALTRQ